MNRQLMLDEDQLARERILSDLDTTLLVEAGAGSGKTTSLVGRMINLVRVAKVPVERIAAITFTNKAAAELKTRFRMKLEQVLRDSGDDADRAVLTIAMQNLNQIFIGTIHAFCGQLLRQRPIEAGLDPAFAELDEAQSAAFRDACWDLYLEHLRDQGREAEIDRLLALDVNVEDLHKVYLRVSQYEDVEVFRQPVPRPDFDLIRLSLPDMLRDAWSWMPANEPGGGWDGLQSLVIAARRLLRYKDLSDDMNVLQLARLFEAPINVTQYKWKDKSQGKAMKDAFMDWQNRVLKPFMQAWREYVHPQVIEFVQPAVAFARAKRMEGALVDFQDLLLKATELLREHSDVRRYFARKYTHLLVDEFQDTDPIQAEMMFLLTGDRQDETDWRKLTPKPGSLFIVGDPKQSIYRFRRADIALYNAVKERIQACGDVLRLTRNFRSVQSIGAFVNYAFESKFAMPGTASTEQAPYVQMLTDQPDPKAAKAQAGVKVLPIRSESWRQSVITELDAEEIAQWIAWACQGNLEIQTRNEAGKPVTRPAHPGDFMILMKRKAFLGLYAEKLEKYGIPSDTSGGQSVYEELEALYTLVTCLNDTSDRIPLLAALRGMLFGVSDDALYHYRREAGMIALYPLPERESLSAKAAPVYDALLAIGTFAGWTRTLPAWTALSKIVHHLGLIPYAAVKEIGALRSGTFVKLLQILQSDARTAANWHALTEAIGQMLGTEALESTSLFAGTGNAVRIMNLHKAKGLEAPVVFLACPCGHKDYDAEEHVDRMSDPARGYFTISRPKGAYDKELLAQPAGWTELAEKERGFMLAEQDRLLYVAATRARQLLVVSRYLAKPAIDPWTPLANALEKQPLLDVVEAEIARPEPLESDVRVEQALASWSEWLDHAGTKTYDAVSVTELTKASGGDIHMKRSAEGRGMAFGSVVHRCLEELGNGLPLEQLPAATAWIASQERLDAELVPQAVAAAEQVLAHPIWQRALQAKRRLHEFAFTATDSGGDGQDAVLKGVIDLAFEEEDGWVIVDFKTDVFDERHADAFAEYYEPQVALYRSQWRRFGYPVKEVGLYFLHLNRYLPQR